MAANRRRMASRCCGCTGLWAEKASIHAWVGCGWICTSGSMAKPPASGQTCRKLRSIDRFQYFKEKPVY